MAVVITIQGTPINFPSSGASPNWAPAVIQFAEAVEAALQGVVGNFDIVPQTFNITAVPNAVATNIPNLAFSIAEVRGAFIRYSVFRETTSANASETGEFRISYNPNNSPGSQWESNRISTGNASIDLTITDTGQVQITLTALGGSNHVGQFNFTAQALEQQY